MNNLQPGGQLSARAKANLNAMLQNSATLKKQCELQPTDTTDNLRRAVELPKEHRASLLKVAGWLKRRFGTDLPSLARPTLGDKVRVLLDSEEGLRVAMEATDDRAERDGLWRERMAILRKVARMVNARYGVGLQVRHEVYVTVNDAEFNA